jgi:hypothetical protein
MKRSFFVRACWDGEAKVFYAESDIDGLHIESATIDEFEALMLDLAPELILSNHYYAADLADRPLKDLVPAILWQRPSLAPACSC